MTGVVNCLRLEVVAVVVVLHSVVAALAGLLAVVAESLQEEEGLHQHRKVAKLLGLSVQLVLVQISGCGLGRGHRLSLQGMGAASGNKNVEIKSVQ